jgi:hypothetical protein
MMSAGAIQEDKKLVIVGEAESEGKLKSLLLENSGRARTPKYLIQQLTQSFSGLIMMCNFLGFQSNPYQFMKRSKCCCSSLRYLKVSPTLFIGSNAVRIASYCCRLQFS